MKYVHENMVWIVLILSILVYNMFDSYNKSQVKIAEAQTHWVKP